MSTTKAIKFQNGMSKAKARLLAHLIADGSVYRAGKNKTNYWIKYEVKDRKQLQEFATDIEQVYGLDAKWGSNPSGFTGKLIPFVFLRSKLAFEDLTRYGSFRSSEWCIPNEILSSSKEIKKEFLRAFFDDEGTVTQNMLRAYSINLKGLEQVKELLKEFHIFTKIKQGFGMRRNVFGLIIKDKKSILNFHRKIGFKLDNKRKKLLLLSKSLT